MPTLKNLGSVRALAAAFALALAYGFLAACGGGGGGGGQSPQSQVPPSFNFSFEEGPHTNTQMKGTTFQFYAPTTDLPTNLVLTGADAAPFTVLLSAGEANASGYRTMTLQVSHTSLFNYEDPQDANKDNVYTFVFSLVYRGQTLSTTINVAITDIADNIELEGLKIEGEAVNQLFGLDIIGIPDITGDGKPELGASILSGLGPASAYIISSEFYTSIPKGTLSVANLANGGTKFSQAPPANPGNINRDTVKPNLLSALARPSGQGVDILLSDDQRKKAYLIQLQQASDYTTLRGTIDPDTISNAVVYTFSGSIPREARLVGDVNGDGYNDIFVQEIRAGFLAPGKFGIIFGRPVTSPSDRNRNDTFDIELIPSFLGDNLPRLITKLIPDISGDGFAELIISVPDEAMSFYYSTVTEGRIYLVKSPILRGTTPVSLTLQSTPTDVKYFRPVSGYSFIQIDDLDNDGIRSLYIGTGGGAYVIDGHDFSDAPGSNTLMMDPPTKTLQGGAGGRLVAAVDFDNDGVADYLGSPRTGTMGGTASGARVQQGLAQISTNDPNAPGGRLIEMQRAVGYQSAEGNQSVWLGQSGLAAFGFASLDAALRGVTTVSGSSGKIVLVREADIKLGISSAGSRQLEIR